MINEKLYSDGRICKHCGIKIKNNSKSGFCGKCYPKYGMMGKNNPFYGKTHSKETREKLKISCAKASQKMWLNHEYRKKVLDAVTGLKRSDEFRKLQSEHAKQQFNDPYQRKIRSEKMKESWQNGSIVRTKQPSSNTSKQEHKFYLTLKEIFGNICLDKQTIKYVDENNKNRWLFPDILFPEIKLVVEYNGSFWHADPKRFNPDDIVHRNITAKEIWEVNNKKTKIYESLGYNVFIVWSDDYKENKKQILEDIKILVNNLTDK